MRKTMWKKQLLHQMNLKTNTLKKISFSVSLRRRRRSCRSFEVGFLVDAEGAVESMLRPLVAPWKVKSKRSLENMENQIKESKKLKTNKQRLNNSGKKRSAYRGATIAISASSAGGGGGGGGERLRRFIDGVLVLKKEKLKYEFGKAAGKTKWKVVKKWKHHLKKNGNQKLEKKLMSQASLQTLSSYDDLCSLLLQPTLLLHLEQLVRH